LKEELVNKVITIKQKISEYTRAADKLTFTTVAKFHRELLLANEKKTTPVDAELLAPEKKRSKKALKQLLKEENPVDNELKRLREQVKKLEQQKANSSVDHLSNQIANQSLENNNNNQSDQQQSDQVASSESETEKDSETNDMES